MTLKHQYMRAANDLLGLMHKYWVCLATQIEIGKDVLMVSPEKEVWRDLYNDYLIGKDYGDKGDFEAYCKTAELYFNLLSESQGKGIDEIGELFHLKCDPEKIDQAVKQLYNEYVDMAFDYI